MRMSFRFVTALLLCLLVPVLLQGPAWAQAPAPAPAPAPAQINRAMVPAAQGQQPVMQNVFFNVVWGSAFGATLGVAVAVIGSNNKSAPNAVRQSAFSGATAGGLIGLGLALYLVYQGITFDPAASTLSISANDPAAPPPVQLAQAGDAPFTLLTSPADPHKVTGFSARVINLKF
jgi:hypothetical protein